MTQNWHNNKHSGSILSNARVACETQLCVTTKKKWLLDRYTDWWRDRRWTKWSLCAAMLRRWHKNVRYMYSPVSSCFALPIRWAMKSVSHNMWYKYMKYCASHTTYPPASSGSALPIRWAMKSVSHSMWMCRSLEQHRSPSYSTAQYPFSTVQSRSPTRMLYARCTFALHSEQNLKQNRRFLLISTELHVPRFICWWNDGSLHVQHMDRLYRW